MASCGLSFTSAIVALVVGVSPAHSIDFDVALRTDLEALFKPQGHGWLGGDSSMSLCLTGSTYLWLFGDTLVGDRDSNGNRVHGWRMPHQSVGFLNTSDSASGMQLRYYIPKGEAMYDVEGCPSCLYWFVGGVVGSAGNLFIQAWNIGETDWIGRTLIVVDDPMQDPSRWRYRSRDFPANQSCSLTQGMARLSEHGRSHVYILGSCGNSAFLARCDEIYLASLRLDRVEVWDGLEWSSNWDRAAHLFPSFGFTEGTLDWNPHLQLWVVPILQNTDPVVRLATSPALVGPWSVQAVYNIPATWLSEQNRTAYAAKNHPELASSPGGLVVSYNTNAMDGSKQDPWRHGDRNHGLSNGSVYRPRFIELIPSGAGKTIYT